MAADADTDPKAEKWWKSVQWCALHQGPSKDVEPLRRMVLFTRGGRSARKLEIVLCCPRCLRILRRTGRTHYQMWGGFECQEIDVKPKAVGTRLPYQVELEEWQVVLLRARGFRLVEDNGPDLSTPPCVQG